MEGQHHPPAAYTPGKNPVRIVQEAGWAQGPPGRVQKISSPQGFDPPDRPARNKSLYRLRYPGRKFDRYFLQMGTNV